MKLKKLWFAVLVVFMMMCLWFKNTGMEQGQFWGLYGIGIAIWFLGAVVINQKWLKAFYQEIDAKTPLFKENPDQYIKEMEEMLEGKKSPMLIAMLINNIGAGYMQKKEYETARQKLLTVPEKGLKGSIAPIYYANLAQALYCSGKEDAFLKLLVLKVKELDMFQKMAKENPAWQVMVTSMDLYRMLAEGQKAEVKKILAEHPEWKQDENWKNELEVIKQRLK